MIIGRRDTIAAIATPAGAGGIGIVRVSGPEARALVARVIDRAPERLPDRRLVYGIARDPDRARIDEVLVVVMDGPRSYTGEQVAELHGHGGSANMGRLLEAVLAGGARAAEPGEFTRRAFENGRLDLVRAEAVIDVIRAETELGWRQAQNQLEGRLGQRIEELRQRAVGLVAEVEASIDFPEEDLELVRQAEVAARARSLADELEQLARTHARGRAIRDGVDVAIVGPVNAGKSSLFNALLGRQRAIVTAEPGTTRDFVEADVVWQGLLVTLIDTAGVRAVDGGTGDAERQGIALGRARGERARLRVVVHEAGVGELAPAGDSSSLELHVVTKADRWRDDAAPDGEWVVTSAVRDQGIAELRRAIVARVTGDGVDCGEGVVVTSERQRALLGRARDALRRGADAIDGRAAVEVVALELREAMTAIAEILGAQVGDDVLDQVFSRFCIGK